MGWIFFRTHYEEIDQLSHNLCRNLFQRGRVEKMSKNTNITGQRNSLVWPNKHGEIILDCRDNNCNAEEISIGSTNSLSVDLLLSNEDGSESSQKKFFSASKRDENRDSTKKKKGSDHYFTSPNSTIMDPRDISSISIPRAESYSTPKTSYGMHRNKKQQSGMVVVSPPLVKARHSDQNASFESTMIIDDGINRFKKERDNTDMILRSIISGESNDMGAWKRELLVDNLESFSSHLENSRKNGWDYDDSNRDLSSFSDDNDDDDDDDDIEEDEETKTDPCSVEY